jgi:hypothetical protein
MKTTRNREHATVAAAAAGLAICVNAAPATSAMEQNYGMYYSANCNTYSAKSRSTRASYATTDVSAEIPVTAR